MPNYTPNVPPQPPFSQTVTLAYSPTTGVTAGTFTGWQDHSEIRWPVSQISGTFTIYGDPDDQITEATPLGAMTTTRLAFASGTPRVPASLTLDDPEDVDMYSFSAVAGQRIGIDVDLLSAGLNPYLRLFNAAGSLLRSNDNGAAWGEASGTLESFIDYTFPNSGTYYVGVSAAGNNVYDPVTGLGDSAGTTTGQYVLVASPGLTGTISGDVGLGPQTFVVDVLRKGANPMPISTSSAENWMVIHGRVSSRDTTSPPNLPRLITDIGASRPFAQVMSLDWSGPANSVASDQDLRQEDWIQPVAIWAAAALKAYGMSGPSLNLVGHSWGANVADELAERLPGGVNTIVALDPAANGPDIFGIGGIYNPDIDVNFAAHSRFSWAFFSRDGHLLTYGNPVTAATADESIVVTGSEHSLCVNLFSWMLENPTVGAGPYFLLDRLLAGVRRNWAIDSYNSDGSRVLGGPASARPFEASVKAGTDGQTAPTPPRFVISQTSGALDVGNGSIDLGTNSVFDSISIGAGGSLSIDSDSGLTVKTGLLTITPGGILDLNDNDLIVSDSAITVADLIRSGRAGGAWTGSGIISSTAKGDALGSTTLGFANATDFQLPFGRTAMLYAAALNSTAVLIRYTLYGDADLDRTVGSADYNAFAAHVGQTGQPWSAGDFDYDGAVGFADRNLLYTQFGKTLLSPAGSISGTVFVDANHSGVFDAGDAALSGRAVYLDIDGNAKQDANEPVRTSDLQGRYNFNALGPGNYVVREVVPSGSQQTLPANNAARAVTLALGEQRLLQDFGVTGSAVTVSGRFLFYNNSKFDGFSGVANASDDAAIATDKSALVLSGGKALSANLSSYDKGINGIMIDVAGLPAGTGPAAGAFDVAVSIDGVTWSAGPVPTVSVRRAVSASVDRITLIWPDNSIKNKWLRLTMKATAATGLATPDISYWGSAVGDTGNGLVTDATINIDSSDYYGVRDHLRSYSNPAPVTWNWDINRDGLTDITDIMLVRASATTASTALKLITAPQSPAAVQTAPGSTVSDKTAGQTQALMPIPTPTPTATSVVTPVTAPTTTSTGTTPPAQPVTPVVKPTVKKRFGARSLIHWGTR